MQCGRQLHVVMLKEFEKITNYVKELDVKAHEWLSKVLPSTWSRSHFNKVTWKAKKAEEESS